MRNKKSVYTEMMDVPGFVGYGRWEESIWQDNEGNVWVGVKVTPDRAPWSSLFEALDVAGESMSGAPVSYSQESAAIVACCLGFGSYFHNLTFGEKFKFSRNMSRITDYEMRRINIEFSSALAQWWKDKAADAERVNRRVRAALRHLYHIPVYELDSDVRASQGADFGSALIRIKSETAEELRQMLGLQQAVQPPVTLRQEANYAVAQCYRNSIIDGYHAGESSPATEMPGYQRFSGAEINTIMHETMNGLDNHLILHDKLNPDTLATLIVYDLLNPRSWSLTEETAAVEYVGGRDRTQVIARIENLVQRYPCVYNTVS